MIRQLRSSLGEAVRVERQSEDVGAVRNIAWCIRAARGRYVWTVSDDDVLDYDALRLKEVVDRLRRHPELELLVLNYSLRDVRHGLLYDRCFDVHTETAWPNGRDTYLRFLQRRHPARWGGLALTTALVCRTTTAENALDSWPDGESNGNLQLYVITYVAAAGAMTITTRPLLECVGGTHHFMADDRTFLEFLVADYAESFSS